MDLDKPWRQYSFVAFDTETSGAYPVGDEIVEVGMVKWAVGQEVAIYQQLLKPNKPMSDFIISIHGITNEMVASAPPVGDKIQEIRRFLDGAIPIAHHAPFDMGFFAYEFEKAMLNFPTEPVICSSLLSRNVISGTENHKLQTLVKHFGLNGGQAHRALDDARACLQVALKCFEKIGEGATLRDILRKQGKDLQWVNYSILNLTREEKFKNLVAAIEQDRSIEFVYNAGSLRGKTRSAKPLGIVRNPDGDYLQAICHIDNTAKRFYLSKIIEVGAIL